MNYEKIYDTLIYKRKHIEILKDNDVFEQHHIIPRSIRPDLEFEQTNIVRLTLKEHFICHQLLEKIYSQKYGLNSTEHQKMINALFIMSSYKRYGKILSSRQYEQLRLKYKKNIGDILKAAWKNYPKEKMDKLRAKRSINSSGKNNPMFGRSWKEGKTETEILQHRIRTSIGLKNRTLEQKQVSINKMNETNRKKKLEERLKTIQKRNASRKKFYDEHPEKLKEKHEKIRKASLGRKKLFKIGEVPIYVRAEEIQKYLDNGWKYSLREIDKTNPAYGRRWMHIKGSSKKEDRIYVKKEDIDYYLKLGYSLGFNDKSKTDSRNIDTFH